MTGFFDDDSCLRARLSLQLFTSSDEMPQLAKHITAVSFLLAPTAKNASSASSVHRHRVPGHGPSCLITALVD